MIGGRNRGLNVVKLHMYDMLVTVGAKKNQKQKQTLNEQENQRWNHNNVNRRFNHVSLSCPDATVFAGVFVHLNVHASAAPTDE